MGLGNVLLWTGSAASQISLSPKQPNEIQTIPLNKATTGENLFHKANIFCSHSPVPQALSLTWHAETIPVVGEVAEKKQDEK